MPLHYQSTYSTSHVCHPAYSGFKRPHLPHHSLWQRTTGNDCWLNGELTSTEGAWLGGHVCHVTGTTSIVNDKYEMYSMSVCSEGNRHTAVGQEKGVSNIPYYKCHITKLDTVVMPTTFILLLSIHMASHNLYLVWTACTWKC